MEVLTRMPEILKQALKKAAEQKGISLNAQMLTILWKWYESETEEDT